MTQSSADHGVVGWFKELAQYVAPKRKAVEMQGEMGVSLRASYQHDL